MALFKKNISKGNNIVAERVSQPVIKNYEQEPVQAATIVINSIQQGNYSEISQKLEELPSTGFRRTQYVFEGPRKTIFKWIFPLQHSSQVQHFQHESLLDHPQLTSWSTILCS